MKKSLLCLIVFFMSIHLTTVSAETFASYYPGGKNYINPDNIVVEITDFYTVEPIKVKADQIYTLSFPNRDMLGRDITILIEGDITYVYELAPNQICVEESNMIVCTFTTTSNETNISIELQSELMGLYYSYFGLDLFQLEEGDSMTEYEEYISPFIDIEGPGFQGSGAFITSYDSNILLSEIISSHIIAYDEIDGDVTNQIEIVSDQYTGNESNVGDYLVELAVSDTSGNQTTFDLYVFVKDEVLPVIVSPDEIYLNVDDGLLIDTIISSYIEYSDEYDLSPTLNIVTDLYSGNEQIVGEYTVSLEVVDSSNNTVSKEILIRVEDSTSPILQSTSIFDIDVSNPLEMTDLITSLDLSDNYDSSVDVVIVNDQYTPNQSIVGTHFVDVELVDDYNNKTAITLTINVIDYDAPSIIGPSEVTTSYAEVITINTFKEMFSVSDNYDDITVEDLSINSDQYTPNKNIPGTYYIEFQLMDQSGNQTTIELEIIVVDDVSPVIYIDQHIVVVDSNSTFGESDMLKLLRMANEINEQEYSVLTLLDEYSGNEDKVGDYIYKVKLIDELGEEMIKEFKISVTEKERLSISELKMPILYTTLGISVIIGAIIYRKYK